METTNTTTRAPRRRRPGGVNCRRPGCGQPREVYSGGRRDFCSYLCRVIHIEVHKTQRVCQAVGASPVTGDLWASVVALGDQLTEYLAAADGVRETARSVGITDEQWRAIEDGSPL